MAFFQIEYSSDVLGQYRQVDVIYPDRDQIAETETVVVVDGYFSVAVTALRGDENHTKWRARSVDRGGGGILQDRDACNVLWVDGVEISLNTVDQYQRGTTGTLTDGTGATHVDR